MRVLASATLIFVVHLHLHVEAATAADVIYIQGSTVNPTKLAYRESSHRLREAMVI